MILAIDPGLATGLARFYNDLNFQSGILEGGFDAMSDELALLVPATIEFVVIENFIPRGGALTIQLDALHIIGAVKHWCRQERKPLIIQSPAQAKSFATNDKLKACGWFNKGTEGHDNDAARHMLVACASGKVGPIARQIVLGRITG